MSPLAGPPQVITRPRTPAEQMAEVYRELGIRPEFRSGPTLSPGAEMQRVREDLGLLNPEVELQEIGPQVSDSARQVLDSQTTPIEELSGRRYTEQPGEDDEASFLLDVGKEFAMSFNPFEPGIGTRERLFRAANVGSLALPFGWAARVPWLMKSFPMLRALTASKKGQVALGAASEAVVSGGLEAIRGPDPETGDTQVAVQTALGGALGGVMAMFGGATGRAVRSAYGQRVKERLADVENIARANSPLFTERYAVIRGGDPGFNRETQAKIHSEMVAALDDQGYELVSTKIGNRDGVLVPGMTEEAAIAMARETGAKQVVTERGLIDLTNGLVYPSERARSAVGKAVDPGTDFHMLLKTDGGDVLYRPGFNTDEPVRLGQKLPTGEASARLGAAIDDRAERGFTSRVWEAFRDLDMGAALSKFYRNTVRSVAGVRPLDELIAEGGESAKLAAHESLEKTAEVLKNRFASFTEMAMRHGVPVWDAPVGRTGGELTARTSHRGLFQIWRDYLVPDEMKDFEKYGMARRLLSIAREHGEEALPRFEGRPLLSLEEAESLTLMAPDNFKKAFDETLTFQNAVMEETLVKSGLITREQFEAITRNADGSLRDFVPLSRVDDASRLVEDSESTGFFALFDPVKRLATETTDEVTFEPWTSEIVRRTAMYARLADKQRLANDVAERALSVVERGPGGEVTEAGRQALARLGLEVVDGPPGTLAQGGEKVMATLQDTDAGLARALEDAAGDAGEEALGQIATAFQAPALRLGEENYLRRAAAGDAPQWFRVTDQGLWDTLRSLDPVDLGALQGTVQAASLPASILRTTVTQSFEFLAKNPIRDVAFAWINAGLNPLMAVRGASSLIAEKFGGGDEFFQAWMASGGPRSALVSLDRPALRNLIKESGTTGATGVERLTNVVKSPKDWFEALRGFSEGLENMTRLGAFRSEFGRLTKEGLDPTQAAMDAALASKRVSVNFSMTGANKYASGLRGVTAFWNAAVQGVDQLGRSFIDDPVGFVGRGSVLGAISTGLYMVNRDDPEYQSGIQDWEKNLFWHIKTPGDEWIRIPKPFEPGILFGSMTERFLESVDNQDRRILDDAFSTAAGDFGAAMMPMPTVFQPILENATNKDMLTGAPVVPRGLEDVDPDFQVGGRTSNLAIGLARFLNQGAESASEKISPLSIDNFLEGITGGLGRFAYSDVPEALADGYRVAVEGRSPEPRRSIGGAARRFPLTRGFMSTYPYSSQPVDDLYSIADEARIASRTATYLEQSFQVDDYVDYLRERAGVLNLGGQITDNLDRIAEIRERRDQALASNMPIQQKRKAMLDFTRQMTALARPLVEVLEAQGVRP